MATVRARTGRDWDDWFAALDEWGAAERSHGEIVDWLGTQGIGNWWAQHVTVEYERARGLRAPNQARGGGFSATASKTVAVSIERLYDAFTADAVHAGATVRTATPPKSWRADWPDGTRLAVGFVSKGGGKAQVALAHEKLADTAAVARSKALWQERLAALKALLET
ncbi:hypothetical protein [Amycolatopsis sp.]|uniref:hypothetical protein n=1 Tax=Amycolatopsis sp. TaxID=37632 RepID=UPI002BA0C3C0|nr:hypothetical protein [Amycolatopsis sp.]HVV09834.1 hypothetical protein [Amycolatopsis sp.]